MGSGSLLDGKTVVGRCLLGWGLPGGAPALWCCLAGVAGRMLIRVTIWCMLSRAGLQVQLWTFIFWSGKGVFHQGCSAARAVAACPDSSSDWDSPCLCLT